jgi:site-specific recombinase/resolvase
MIYAYIRVSTEKQTVENQRFEINNWAQNKHITIDRYVEEILSGTVAIGHRKLGELSKELQRDDVLIVSELSRLGRSLLNVMSFLNVCIERNIKVFSIKENFEFADNINSKVLAFAFSLAAEIERQLISQRTKEALALRRAQGVVLGRP